MQKKIRKNLRTGWIGLSTGALFRFIFVKITRKKITRRRFKRAQTTQGDDPEQDKNILVPASLNLAPSKRITHGQK